MSIFRKIGNIFKKGAQGTANLFTKAGQEVKGAITRSAQSIGGSAGGLGGSAIGLELAGPLGAIIGGSIGSEIGKRTAQEIGKATAPNRRDKITTKPVQENVNNLNSKINPIVAQYKNPRGFVGGDGGKRIMYNKEETKNDLEKVRVKKEEQKQKFV